MKFSFKIQPFQTDAVEVSHGFFKASPTMQACPIGVISEPFRDLAYS